MKTLSIQQPWATLLAAGIKDMENRTWTTKFRGKLLLHASGKTVPRHTLDELPYEMFIPIVNAQIFGNIPEFADMPTGAIVGYADLTDCITEDTMTIWDGGPDCTKFVMQNAYVFDEPIEGVKGKLNIFDYPELDENNLPPAHQCYDNVPSVIGTTIRIPVAKETFELLKSGELTEFKFMIDFTREYTDKLLANDNDFTLVPMKKALFVSGSEEFELPIKDVDAVNLLNEAGEPMTIPCMFQEKAASPVWLYFTF